MITPNELIKKYRLKSGLTRIELAKKCRIHKQYLSSVESGKITIGLRSAKKFRNALSIPKTKMMQSLISEYQQKVVKSI